MVLKDKVMCREVQSAFESLALPEADDITYLRGLEPFDAVYITCDLLW